MREKSFSLHHLPNNGVSFSFFSFFCNARCARDRFWSQSNWFYQLISLVFLRSQITNVVQSLILTLVLITFLSTASMDLGSKIQLFLEEIFFFFFCPKLALFFWGYEKTSSSYHVQSLRRTGAKTSRFRLGSPADRAWKPGAWRAGGSAEFGLYAGFGSLRVTALQAGISRWKETAALQRANDAQLPSKLGTIYYHLQLFSSLKRKYSFYFFNTSYLTDSYIVFTLKMESVSKNTIFGLKMMVRSGLEKFNLKQNFSRQKN